MSEPLLLERRDSVAWLTLNRPAALNALSPDLMAALDAAAGKLAADEAVRAVVITGAGRAFCAGGDLKAFLDAAQADLGTLRDIIAANQRVLGRIEALPVPVIAAVNGVAAAGGLELALCADLILAADTARLGDAHARYGIIPAGGATVRLRERLSLSHAAELVLSGDLYPAATLATWGLVNEVLPPEQLLARAEGWATRLARGSTHTLRRMKALLRPAEPRSRAAAFLAEVESFAAHAQGRDFREGLAAFVEKREPVF